MAVDPTIAIDRLTAEAQRLENALKSVQQRIAALEKTSSTDA
jgi:hypothetical protein